MFFYPGFINNPIRYTGNLSVASFANETKYLMKYTDVEMARWSDLRTLIRKFMGISFRGEDGDIEAVAAEAVEYQIKITKYFKVFEQMRKDVSQLAVKSNEYRLKLLNYEKTALAEDRQTFLDMKEDSFIFDQFLQHMFSKKKIPKMRQKKEFSTAGKKKIKKVIPPKPTEECL